MLASNDRRDLSPNGLFTLISFLIILRSMEAKKKRIQELLIKKKAEKAKTKAEEPKQPRQLEDGEEVINGLEQEEIQYMDEEDAVIAEDGKRPKHLLKHFRVQDTVDSFFTGGSVHFCKDSKSVFAQYGHSVVRYDLEARKVDYELSHVAV